MRKISRRIEEWNHKEWEFYGREIEIRDRGIWEDDNQDGVKRDEYTPMVNYAYPIEEKPKDTEVYKVHERTNLTVVRKKKTDEYYLALTACGMNLSQDIAMGFIIAENKVPLEVAAEVNTQKELTQHGTNYLEVLKECKKSLKSIDYKVDRISEAIGEFTGDENED